MSANDDLLLNYKNSIDTDDGQINCLDEFDSSYEYEHVFEQMSKNYVLFTKCDKFMGESLNLLSEVLKYP